MLGITLNLEEYLSRCSEEFKKLDLTQAERMAEDIYSAYEEGRFV
ncbi:hypothetical protein MNBD_PLANCTO02-1079, partial [hydrothermal vent metagenome]